MVDIETWDALTGRWDALPRRKQNWVIGYVAARAPAELEYALDRAERALGLEQQLRAEEEADGDARVR